MGLISSVPLAKWYLSLAPVQMPDYYENPQPLQRPVMEYEDECSEAGFHQQFGMDLRGKDVLDLGCGYGGRTVRYKELGSRSVTGIEISAEVVAEAVRFAEHKNVSVSILRGVGESLPLEDESTDVVLSYDVLEHVESVARTIRECYRVLRQGGTLYAAFPPFYNPTGGSHLHGYVSLSPAPNLLFRCDALREAVDDILDKNGTKFRHHRRPTDPLPMVNGTTIGAFSRILESIPFSKKTVRLEPMQSNRLGRFNALFKLGSTVPVLREVFTNRIVCELTK